jgi:hypothetical protein
MANEKTSEARNSDISSVRKRLITDVGSYFGKCCLKRASITTMSIVYALEASYRPVPVFWRAFDWQFVLEAAEAYAPGFLKALFSNESQTVELVQNVQLHLAMRFSDESNAERLLSLPDEQRPTASTSAYHWLLRELTNSGEHAEAGYLKQDGFQGAETALQLVAAQVAARDGREFQTHGMQQATMFYHAMAVIGPFEELCDE